MEKTSNEERFVALSEKLSAKLSVQEEQLSLALKEKEDISSQRQEELDHYKEQVRIVISTMQ